MTTPAPEALPTPYEFGRVIGRFLRAVGDGEDVDSVPEAVPAKGTVTFTPITTSRILIDSSSEPSPLITHEAITCTLDAYGHISRTGVPANGIRPRRGLMVNPFCTAGQASSSTLLFNLFAEITKTFH